MKIGLVIVQYYPFGGLQKSFWNIASALKEAGHDIHILTLEWEAPLPENMSVTILKTSAYTNHGRIAELSRRIPAFRTANACDFMIGFNRLENLDYYYAGDICYKRYIKECRSPLVKLSPRYKTLAKIESSIFNPDSSVKILAISKREKQIYQEEYGTQDERFLLLAPGIRIDLETARSASRNVREELGIPSDQRLFLMVGSDFNRKGVDRGIWLLAKLLEQQVFGHLVVIGKGKEGALKSRLRKLNVQDRVHFVGGQRDVPTWMTQSDMLWHLAYQENTGNVIVEALLCGLPVICTDTCGYAHHIADADAGILLSNDFQLHESVACQLAEKLTTDNLNLWSQHANEYASSADLSSRLQQVQRIFSHSK